MKMVVAITGASGVIYGIKLLEILKNLKIETHLIISEWAKRNIKIETIYDLEYVKSLAFKQYEETNLAAPISSGSFKTTGMIVIPCSMKTLSSISHGYDDNLISRSSNVCIKEGRKLVLVPRETPLTKIHLENMLRLSEIGVIILPAMPGFYFSPKTIDDLINHTIGKVLDQFNIEHNLFKRWGQDH